METKYELMTLDPEVIFQTCSVEKSDTRNNIVFSLIYENGHFDNRNALISTDMHRENALLRQLSILLDNSTVDNMPGPRSESDGDSCRLNELKKHFVILDFSAIFKKKKKPEEKFDLEETEESYKKGLSVTKINETKDKIRFGEDINSGLFYLFRNGFSIEYEGKKTHFVAFDSSASMLREARVSFVDASFKDSLDERLMLGMNLVGSDIQVRLHKYYAYRGLYLSDGFRIDFDFEKEINEETMIVIDDFMVKKKFAGKNYGSIPQITAKQSSDDSDYWNIESSVEKVEINSFDGEGVICPAYAEKINQKLFGMKKEATSFQIRMPFVKGMLHMVDFEKFFRDECKIDYSKKYIIKDIYGNERDLRKAKIILTKSMLKNWDWMGDYVETAQLGDVPMKVYFDRIRAYDHSLYVTRTNVNLRNDGNVKLNYQFLNTLDMSGENFRNLIQEYIEELNEIKCDANLQRELILGDDGIVDSGWKYALGRNLTFVNDGEIKKKIQEIIESRIKDIYKGRIRVNGENRFLSGDLLSLLLHIYKKGHHNKKIEKELKSHLIKSYEFKMLSTRKKLNVGKKYGFLRNPHLSRNEDCFLVCAQPDKYDEYFSHLSGVVMVASNSLAPMTLGGADFDGDIVKMISDLDIIKAMISGKEKCEEIVVIPAVKEGVSQVPGGISYKFVKDIFGNQIGLISNNALRLGEQIYNNNTTIVQESDQNSDKHKYVPADCTLLTGIEIDAAKTGSHPQKNIKELIDQINEQTEKAKKNNKNIYMDYLNTIKEIERIDENEYIYINDTKAKLDEGICGIVYKDETKKGKKATLVISEAKLLEQDNDMISSLPNIELLPSLYVEAMYGNRITRKANKEFQFRRENAFNLCFDIKTDSNIYKKALAIRNVFNNFCRRLILLHRQDTTETEIKSNWYGKACSILQKQYYGRDDFNAKKEGLANIYFLIERFILDTESCLAEYGDTVKKRADNILEKMGMGDEIKEDNIGDKWIFTPSDKRRNRFLEIIPLNTVKENHDIDTSISIVTNFSKKGYMILYYIVRDIKEQNINNDKVKKENIQISAKSITDDEKYNEMYKEIFKELSETYAMVVNEKYSYSMLESMMLDKIEEFLIEEDVKTYAGVFYDISESFFWKFFDDRNRFNKLIKAGVINDFYPYKKIRMMDKDIIETETFEEEEEYYAG